MWLFYGHAWLSLARGRTAALRSHAVGILPSRFGYSGTLHAIIFGGHTCSSHVAPHRSTGTYRGFATLPPRLCDTHLYSPLFLSHPHATYGSLVAPRPLMHVAATRHPRIWGLASLFAHDAVAHSGFCHTWYAMVSPAPPGPIGSARLALGAHDGRTLVRAMCAWRPGRTRGTDR